MPVRTNLGSERDTGQQSAATTRHDNHVKLWDLRRNLEPDRARACNDLRIVKPVDVPQVCPLGTGAALFTRLLDVAPVQDDVGSELAAALHLGQGRDRWHDDRDWDVELASV
jgi:hypothetical protein